MAHFMLLLLRRRNISICLNTEMFSKMWPMNFARSISLTTKRRKLQKLDIWSIIPNQYVLRIIGLFAEFDSMEAEDLGMAKLVPLP